MRRPTVSESVTAQSPSTLKLAASDMSRYLCCDMQSRDIPQGSRKFRPLTGRSRLQALHLA